MSACTCQWRTRHLPSGYELLVQKRDRNCPLHGNRVMFDPLANARVALKLRRRAK